MRKNCFLLLLLMLCLCAAFALADAEGDFIYSVSGGEAKTTAYTGSADTLIVPSALNGYPVTAIGYCAFRSCTSLSSIVLPDSITSIGSNAFHSCLSLSQVSLPDSLVLLGSHAFYSCPALKEITIPGSLKRLHPYAFYGCSAVRFCSLSGQAARTLTDYRYTFSSPDYPLLSFKAFEDNAGMRTFTVADCDESAVSVLLPGGVTGIDGYAFFNCSMLAELALPDSVTEIAYIAFEGCSALRQIIIPSADAVIAADAFSGCKDVLIIAPDNSSAQAIARAHAADGFTWRAL